jgi:hypothetical protein
MWQSSTIGHAAKVMGWSLILEVCHSIVENLAGQLAPEYRILDIATNVTRGGADEE